MERVAEPPEKILSRDRPLPLCDGWIEPTPVSAAALQGVSPGGVSPGGVSLGRDAVHLWTLALPAPERPLPVERLSSEERVFAAAMRHEPARRTFILSRAFLRDVLGRYTGCAPADIPLIEGRHGKPELNRGWNAAGIHFNLSHGDALCLVAVTATGPVGVDVESLGRPAAPDGARSLALARRYFTVDEGAALARCSSADRRQGFLEIWTRKEAWAKATGLGLGLGLDRFCVLGRAPVSLATRRPRSLARWRLMSWFPQPDHWAAVACREAVRIVLAVDSDNRWP